MVETTALGAAILAGIGVGLIDINDVDASQITKFSPSIGDDGKLRFRCAYFGNNFACYFRERSQIFKVENGC